ncbi:hypothetical protein EON65_06460 [archaeon]|nr:MAG: hypothetical protein EON65_06460 [archaeon]
MVFYVVVGLFLLLAQCLATPYHAPLQGSAGGKRTLVLMDDLVGASNLEDKYTSYFNVLFCYPACLTGESP